MCHRLESVSFAISHPVQRYHRFNQPSPRRGMKIHKSTNDRRADFRETETAVRVAPAPVVVAVVVSCSPFPPGATAHVLLQILVKKLKWIPGRDSRVVRRNTSPCVCGRLLAVHVRSPAKCATTIRIAAPSALVRPGRSPSRARPPSEASFSLFFLRVFFSFSFLPRPDWLLSRGRLLSFVRDYFSRPFCFRAPFSLPFTSSFGGPGWM